MPKDRTPNRNESLKKKAYWTRFYALSDEDRLKVEDIWFKAETDMTVAEFFYAEYDNLLKHITKLY